jgi:hypothetical protein
LGLGGADRHSSADGRIRATPTVFHLSSPSFIF